MKRRTSPGVLGLSTLLLVGLLLSGCGGSVTKISPGPNAQKTFQRALINAKTGQVIELAAGKFEISAAMSLDASGVTIRGQGSETTILSFAGQKQGTGGEALLITSESNVTLVDFAIEDAAGDAIKALGCTGLTMRRVRVGWTGGPAEANGGYGLYPVQCRDVLIEDCIAREASDAGIYVGQSDNVIVRRNQVERNVAGIEIENSEHVDVYENKATDNTAGILVFTLPDLQKKVGSHCRVFDNQIVANNRENFAPKGNIVADVPNGTGIMIMANDNVEIFDNKIENNGCLGVGVISYITTERKIEDQQFDPYCEGIFIHDNVLEGNGKKPSGDLGLKVGALLKGTLPNIVYDGVVDPAKLVDGRLPEALSLKIKDNGDADFVNFDFKNLTAMNVAAIMTGFKKMNTDLKAHEGELPRLEPVSIAGVKE